LIAVIVILIFVSALIYKLLSGSKNTRYNPH